MLVAYIKEIGDLLKESHGSLALQPVTATLARVNTLNAIRQLDGSRITHILRFLAETGQLTDTNESTALDISTTELIDIDFSSLKTNKKIQKLSLTGVALRNCTFQNGHLQNTAFSSTLFDNVSFSSVDFTNVNFSFAEFRNVQFLLGRSDNVNFSSAKLDNVDFSSTLLNK